MGELGERRWAVISERGREATHLAYAEAAGLVGELRREKIGGLCVVTEAAAARLAPPAESPPDRGDPQPEAEPRRRNKSGRPTKK